MWPSIALLLTMVLTLLNVFAFHLCTIVQISLEINTGPLWLTKYRKNITACPQNKPQTGWDRNVETT